METQWCQWSLVVILHTMQLAYLPGTLALGSCPLWRFLPTLATSQVYHVPVLARSPISHTPPLGVLGRNWFHHLPLHCQLGAGGNSQHLVLTLVVAPGQNPGKAVWPLCSHWVLGPTREGYTQRRRQGSPPAKPCSTSCFVLRNFSCGSHNSESGHGLLAGL